MASMFGSGFKFGLFAGNFFEENEENNQTSDQAKLVLIFPGGKGANRSFKNPVVRQIELFDKSIVRKQNIKRQEIREKPKVVESFGGRFGSSINFSPVPRTETAFSPSSPTIPPAKISEIGFPTFAPFKKTRPLYRAASPMTPPPKIPDRRFPPGTPIKKKRHLYRAASPMTPPPKIPDRRFPPGAPFKKKPVVNHVPILSGSQTSIGVRPNRKYLGQFLSGVIFPKMFSAAPYKYLVKVTSNRRNVQLSNANVHIRLDAEVKSRMQRTSTLYETVFSVQFSFLRKYEQRRTCSFVVSDSISGQRLYQSPEFKVFSRKKGEEMAFWKKFNLSPQKMRPVNVKKKRTVRKRAVKKRKRGKEDTSCSVKRIKISENEEVVKIEKYEK